MERCDHGMDAGWCYLCRFERSGVDPRAGWGLDVLDDEGDPLLRTGPMRPSQEGFLRFLCDEFAEAFDDTLSEGEATLVVESFLDEPMTNAQARTLGWLAAQAGAAVEEDLTYGQARTQIRRLVALRGLRSA
jgi:Protein of unknown function (DUF3072)